MATTWRPPPELARRLRVVSALVHRSGNEIITEAVTEWLDAHQPQQVAEILSACDQNDPGYRVDTP